VLIKSSQADDNVSRNKQQIRAGTQMMHFYHKKQIPNWMDSGTVFPGFQNKLTSCLNVTSLH